MAPPAPGMADRLTGCDIDKEPRGREKASDHTPIWASFADGPLGPRLA